MMSGRFGATFRQMETLMRVGSVANLPDTHLLERFLDRREGGEAAFEALVARHGAMVMGVCRQVLGSGDGVEDAFQATFLVLVRQAGSIRKRESLGPWLHGVARRVSMRARRDAARRRERERGASFRVVGNDPPDETLAATLHDEIARLPEKYRTPIVLCDLEGQSHAEAARRLDWPIGTVSGRLSRARALLRSRITRRGIALSAAGVASVLGTSSARAAVAPALAKRTAELAMAHASGVSLSPAATALAGAATKSASAFFAKVAAGLVLSTGIGWGGWETMRDRPLPGAAKAPATAQAKIQEAHSLPRIAVAPRPRQIENEHQISSVAIAPDGVTLASGSLDAVVTLWDLETGLEKQTFLGHSGAITSLAFTGDGRMLASASVDHTVRVWDVATGRETLTVTWLEPSEAPARTLGSESSDPDRGAPGQDRCADGPARAADCSGA